MRSAAEIEKDDWFDIRVLALALWGGRLKIILFAIFGLILGILLAWLLPPVFRAEATVQIRQDNSRGGALQSLASQLGPLSALAGGALGGDDSERSVAIATLRSRLIIQSYIGKMNLLPILYPRKWDRDKKQWKRDNSDYVPTLQDGYKRFTKKTFSVAEDKKTSLVTVAVEWTDGNLAAQWVNDLITETNAMLKQRTIAESEANLRYLEDKAKSTSIVELQRALYLLMETELKKLMIARNTEAHVLRIIDPVEVPKKKIRPQRILIAALAFVLGVLGGVGFVLIESAWSRKGAY